MPLFAITGITGHVGRVAARCLLAGGAGVRAVVRDEAKAAPWRRLGAEFAVANLDDIEALKRAFDGVDGVYVMTPTWFESADMFAENIRAVAALSRAIRAACPARVVLLSSVGAQHPTGTGAILKLHHMEQTFADLPGVVAIRAGWFMENYAGLIPHVRATGVLPSMLAPLDRVHPMVATQDIGKLVANILLDKTNSRAVIELEGPQRYAPRDAADALAKVLGQPVVAKVLPPSEWLDTFAQWGLPPRSAEAMSEMLASFNSGHIAFDRGQHARIQGQTALQTVLAGLATR
jgi:NAD(P)H dehydrogenase (quinone)